MPLDAEKVRNIAAEKGVTHASIALSIGWHESHFSRLLANGGDCRLSTIEKIAKALNITVDDILKRK